jgi:hypothetical protein
MFTAVGFWHIGEQEIVTGEDEIPALTEVLAACSKTFVRHFKPRGEGSW